MSNHGKIARYLENKLVRQVLRNESYTPPATVYLALFTTTITEDPNPAVEAMVGTEVTGGSYARQSIAFEIPEDGETTNSSTITFPAPSTDWGTVTHWGLFDASTAGNMLFFGEFDTPRTYDTAIQAVVSPNRIRVKVD